MKAQKFLNKTHPLLQQAIALTQAGNAAEAIATYKKLLLTFPDDPILLNTIGNLSLQTGCFSESVKYNRQSLQIEPEQVVVWFYLGIGLKQLQRYDEALQAFERSIHLQADFAEAFCNRGAVLQELLRFTEALQNFERAIAIRPDYAIAYVNRGISLRNLNRFAEAVASYDQAIALKADFAEAYCYRGVALLDLQRMDEALASYKQALTIKPKLVDAYYNLGQLYFRLQDYPAALESFAQASALKPDIDFLEGQILAIRMQICDWQDFETVASELEAKILGGQRAAYPFAVHAFFDKPALHRQAAEIWSLAKCPANQALPNITAYPEHAKIRIAYFSADFRNHPLAFLSAELFELHDRSRFEISAFSYAASPEKDAMRLRLEKSFDRFIDIRNLADHEAAQLARNMEIDIAVDLGGHTRENRSTLFALRAAPLQLSYLGFLGTMAAQYMDYLLADPILIPEQSRQHYAEKIIYLPSYQVNDSQRPIADLNFSRSYLGLPDQGFVFCCFNNNFKITPQTFSGWMRILQSVADSVLLLYAENPLAEENLLKTALRNGVSSERLVFAKRLPLPEYLARYRAADLFLDTLPYNAGATASDALWAGCPVITCRGESFAGRMAASLLTAIGLPELIAQSQAEYESLAIDLALHPEKLAAIKTKLARNRLSSPLFDSRTFTRRLESAYTQIYQRYRAGLPTEHIFQ